MKRRRAFAKPFVLILIMMLVFTACGSSGSSSFMNSAKSEVGEYAYDDGASYSAGAMAAADTYDMDYETAEEEKAVNTGSTDGEPAEIEPAESSQKLVYTCWMTIQTLEFTETQSAVKEAVRKVGGIIESESVNDSDRYWYSYDSYDSYKRSGTLTSDLVIRVPSSKYEEFLGMLDGAGGKVTSKSQNVENITKRYNDQTIRIESLETQEKRLLEMMERAETIEEMITVETRLTEVQTELNQARSTLSSMDTDVKYSTVHLSLAEVVRYTDTPKTPVSFGERLVNAVKDSWSNFVDFLQDFLIWLIYMIPGILLIAAIVLIVYFVRKAWRKKHPKKKKEKRQNPRMYDQRHFFRRPGNSNDYPAGMNQGPAGGDGFKEGIFVQPDEMNGEPGSGKENSNDTNVNA